MPTIRFEGREIESVKGAPLRATLLKNGLTPHNGLAKTLNCNGHGSCGTCAVEVRGEVSEMTGMESFRLSLPPHKISRGLRLACQVRCLGDVEVVKHPGFWGQQGEASESAKEEAAAEEAAAT